MPWISFAYYCENLSTSSHPPRNISTVSIACSFLYHFLLFVVSFFLLFCFTCNSVGFSAPQTPDCKKPLGLEKGRIFNGSVTASSQENENAGPGNARLNFEGAWSPEDVEQNQWLQVDFGAETRVTGISTQGHYIYDTWVKSYTLRYSDDGSNFKHYQPELYTKVTIMIVTSIAFQNFLTFPW